LTRQSTRGIVSLPIALTIHTAVILSAGRAAAEAEGPAVAFRLVSFLKCCPFTDLFHGAPKNGKNNRRSFDSTGRKERALFRSG
jgi:hypothetical protein